MSVIEKSKNPSLFVVVFFALLMALVGALSGFTLLASIPPKSFESIAKYESHLEKNPKHNLLDVHYFKGSKSPAGEWIQKREILLTASSATVTLTNSEINTWITNTFQKPKVSSSDKEKANILIVPGVPNLFIDATEGINFSMLLEIVIFGKQIDSLLIGKGYFSEENADEFQLSELRLNEATIPLSKKFRDDLLEFLSESFYENDEFVALKKAWEKVDSVELVEDGIRLNLDR